MRCRIVEPAARRVMIKHEPPVWKKSPFVGGEDWEEGCTG